MTPFRIVDEHEHGEIRARVVSCGCPLPDCTTHYLVAQARHDVLWIGVGWTPEDEIPEALDALFEPTGGTITDAADIVEIGLALYGLAWEHITCLEKLAAQIKLFSVCPDWMLRVPRERQWACRRAVFGRDLLRVPAALEALHAAYTDEGPVPLETFQ